MWRARFLPAVIAASAWLGPWAVDGRAQFTEPCEAGCALVLGASSFVFATGTMTVVGRLEGGYSTIGQAITSWSLGFAAAVASGIALGGDGERQRRAIYAGGVGALGGAVAGLAVGSLVHESDSATRFAGALVGAALGVAAGGAIGALTHDGTAGRAPSFAFLGPTFSVPFGF